ncbi:MAG: tRNA uridine-5-carboxymethylaminomethyl(34) synthesis GTPase MnmE [Epsilonproteobacteria bacterium]|nr:MAG: tRNA uridine-5-carboxymethylaminomethyl(34) synthesis GTPase MnmE [Campylobacterota bacterium]
MSCDTIVAISTPRAIGAIAIVRVSGKDALGIAKKLTKKTNIKARYATLSKLYDQSGAMLDEAIVIYFKQPNSYTGEDIVEFQCHGGLVVANMVLDTILKYNISLSSPGEFSKRAYLNGKMDLSQVEAVSNIIQAQSKNAAKMLSRQIDGELTTFVDDVKKQLVEILSFVEVNIDYADELIDDKSLKSINIKLKSLQISLKKLLQNSLYKDGLIHGFAITIIGKPNVGKSSFLNSLLNDKAAIVSHSAGTTRDTITKTIKIGDNIVYISDTAGLRQTNNDIEKQGIEISMQTAKKGDIIVAMFDNSKQFDKDDERVLDFVNSLDKIVINIVNKNDLKNMFDKKRLDSHINLIAKENINIFFEKLETILNNSFDTSQMSLVSNRQISAVQDCLNSINSCDDLLKTSQLELFSFEINQALSFISKITKLYKYDEMLDVMFSKFCLGK